VTQSISIRTALRTGMLAGLAALALLGARGTLAQAPDESEAYQVRPGDSLFISVWGEEGLEQTVIVRPDGGFTFPLAGEFSATGKTISQLTEEIREKLSLFIPEPPVTVGVAEIRGTRLYIIGQVQTPGEFLVNPTVDVMQALSMAGGLNAFASPNDIRILRRRGDEQIAIPFDYSEIIRGRRLEQNIMLRDGDTVIVP
jgi:polysaccharide export outer membrane protein